MALTVNCKKTFSSGTTATTTQAIALTAWTAVSGGTAPATGDLVVLILSWQGTGTSNITQTAGTGTWTRYNTQTESAAPGTDTAIFTRVFDGTETTPTFTCGTSGRVNAAANAITPAAGFTAAIDTEGTPVLSASGTSHSLPSATATASGEISLTLESYNAVSKSTTAITSTTPTGWTLGGSVETTGSSSQYSMICLISFKTGVSGTSSPAATTTNVSASGVGYQLLIHETTSGAAALTVTAGLTAAAALSTTGGSALTVTAGLAAAATYGQSAGTAVTVTAGFAATATVTTSGVTADAALTETAGLAASAQYGAVAAASLTVTAGLSATATRAATAASALTETAGLSATATRATTAAAALTETTGLTAAATYAAVANAAVTVTAGFTATASTGGAATADAALTVTSGQSAAVQYGAAGNAALTAAAGLAAAATRGVTAAAALTVTAGLASAAQLAGAGAASLTVTSGLAASATVTGSGGAPISAPLLAGTITQVPYAGTVTTLAYAGTVTTMQSYAGTITTQPYGGTITPATYGGTITTSPYAGTITGGIVGVQSDLQAIVGNDSYFYLALTYNGAALNLTGYTVKAYLKATRLTPDADAVVFTSGSGLTITNVAGGLVTWDIPHADLPNPATLWYRADVIDASSEVFTALYGNLQVQPA